MYNSPDFGGLTFSASTVLSGNAVYKKTDGTAASKYDLSATYKAGPIVASFAYNKVASMDASWVLGGSYDFGAFKVAGSYNNVGMTGTGAAGIDKKGVTLGVSAPMGPVTLTFDIARATNDQYKNTDFLLEAKYALSKRTFIYGVYMRDGRVTDVVTGATKDVNGIAVGVRHNF
jgi:predicted porin